MIKKLRENIIKGYITSIMGIIIYIITSILIWRGAFGFVWDGLSGYAAGTILLLSPDAVKGFIKQKLNKKNCNDDGGSE